ncbi:MAG TPA: TonB-dependent receptor [Polyangiaceae bacterium]|nr:TonB-dependent receptor [Polyangiaceae bacterium]
MTSVLGACVVLSSAGASFGQESGEGAVPRGGAGAAVKPSEEPKDPKADVRMPELLEFVNAPYPPEAEKAGLEANVVLKLTIDKDGRVTEAEVLEPAGHGFDEAARDAALRFRFKPAMRGDQPIAVKIPYRYSFTLTEVAKAAPAAPPTTGNLTGRIRLSETDAPVAGADVIVTLPDGSERRVATDPEGRYRLDGVPPGKYRVRVSLGGFDPVDSSEEVVAGEETDVTLRLSPVSEGFEVTVRGERPPREVTRRTVERREIERIPGTGGDALRSLQSLPGVARAPGFAGLLIVRGSAPEGTLTFVDGAEVPFIYHFGGLSSAVPTELLERIDFYPGNFSARYGRAGGGIVDVALRSPDTRCYDAKGKLDEAKTGCFHAMLQADLIDARALVQGPLPIDGWSFAIAGRRSWIDTWLRPVLEEAGSSVTSAPVYYDYQVIAERKTGSSKTSVRFYGSDDRLELIITDPFAQDPGFGGNLRFGTAFYRAQVVHESQISSKVSASTTLAVGKDTVDFSVGNFFFNLKAYPIQWRYELAFKMFDGAKLNVGTDFNAAPFDVNVRFPEPPRPGEPDPGPFSSRPPVETSNSGTSFRPAAYAELELQPTDRLRVVPGVRFDYARDSGHEDLAPRLTARYDLVKGAPDAPNRRRTTMKGGAGVFYQPPQFQETDEVFGTPGIKSNRWIHYSLGAEQELTKQVELSVEGFYKDLTQAVSRAPESAGGFGYANLGQGYVVGVETLLKYKPDQRFFGWLAYTLSRSVLQDSPDSPAYLFQYDQTHNLTVLGSYRLGRGWEFGARFRLVSGPLDTPVQSPPALPALFAADAGSYAPLQGRPYSRRLPLFHQLDIRIDKRWQIKNARISAYLDLQNVYNNAAAEGYVYSYDFSKSQYQTGVPILPSIGMRIEI